MASGDAGASMPIEVVINVLLFVPFGLYLGLLRRSWRWFQAAAVLAGASLILESTQHLISVGSFDITDIIVNTAGGLAGFGLLAVLRRHLRAKTTAVMTRVLLIATVIAAVAIGVFIASPLHYGPQRDVIFPSPTASR